MAQESTSKQIAIIGAGPAGCICAKFLYNAGFGVTLFDKDKPLKTLLPTGGGKCNLAHAEYDFKELAKNYPRGEKFLYSIFSKFSTSDTLEFFKSIGVETYTREDNRIFPVSNSSSDVRNKFLKSFRAEFVQETVNSVEKLNNGYKILTNKSSYLFDTVVIATGGMSKNILPKGFDINITEPTQSLVGFTTEKDFKELAGVSIKNVKYKNLTGDILFTHKGISGPLIYTVSSFLAREEFPYILKLLLTKEIQNPQELLNENPHKEIKNLIGQYLPKSFGVWLLEDLDISPDLECSKINGKMRDKIFDRLNDFEVVVTGKIPDSEVVTCGGINLKEVNPKTLEAKNYPNLYFCGEVLDIDGLCGGFNLQNCWSTGYIVAQSIIDNLT